MSGLYTAVFGESPNAKTLLTWLGYRRRDIARWRDTFKTESGEIAIYARLGGGNRPAYQSAIDGVRKHALFKRDEDDSADSTYLTFYFACPAIHARDFADMESERSRAAMWPEKIAAIPLMSNEKMEALLTRLQEEMTVVIPGQSPGTMTIRDLLRGQDWAP